MIVFFLRGGGVGDLPEMGFRQINLIFGRFRMSTCGFKKIVPKNIVWEQF